MRPIRILPVLLALLACDVQAQVIPVYETTYRPPGVEYLVMRSAHFDVIYQAGTEEQARELAAVLEESIPEVSSIFAIRSGFRLPIVLNRFNQRGNGFVTPIPFHSEIDGVPLFGRGLSARHADWLTAVAPHELVHAAQGDYLAGFGVNALLRPFAPDMARALNLWVPPGIAEGAAVYLESNREEGAGRLNHGWFNMRYQAAVGAGKAWTLAQMLEVPRYVRPRDRFYKGGAALMDALADSSGNIPALTRATAFHNRFPLLGYGVSFWYGARKWPRALGQEVRREAEAKEAARADALGSLTESRRIVGRKGVVVRRPRWVDDETLMAYVTGYDVRRGLYAIDASTGRLDNRAHHELTEDLHYSLGPDGTSILASRYIDRPFSGRADADVVRIDLDSGKGQRLTKGAGLLSPVQLPNGSIWAIELDGAFSQWVELDTQGNTAPVVQTARTRFVQIEPNPDYTRAAIVANVRGAQGLYLWNADAPSLELAVLFESGSIYDVTWSPDGEWLVFTADPGGPMNAFAYRPADDNLRQLTNVAYGALEPAVSPDGSRLAFVEFSDQRFELREIPFAPLSAPEGGYAQTKPPEASPFIATTDIATPDGPYRSFQHLKPRLLYPSLYYETTTSTRPGRELGIGGGLALQGADPLTRWSYWGEGFMQGGRPWGEIGITTSASILRPSVRAYRRPDQLLAQIGQGAEADTLRVIRDERGVEFSVRLPITLRDNIHRSAANFALLADVSESRLLGDNDEVLRDWTHNVTVTPIASFGIGLQSNLRDLMLSRGLTFITATEFEFVPDQFGGPATASYNEFNLFLPWLSRLNTGIKLEAASLTQTRGFVFDTDFFMPRGHEDRVPGRGTFLRYGAEVVQPLAFPENGTFIVPAFLHAFYLYGFAERLNRHDDFDVHLSSVGGGIGVEFTLFHVMSMDLRWGRAYRTGNSPELGWTTVYR